MSGELDLGEILEDVIRQAREDNVITQEEQELIDTIKIEGQKIAEELEKLLEDQNTSSIITRIVTQNKQNLVKKAQTTARKDGTVSVEEKNLLKTLLKKLDIEIDLEDRPWYVFKITTTIDSDDDVDELLNALDRVFCMRGLNPANVYSGLCLGTKHYVIDDVDVTLLLFAKTPDNEREWVTKGSFADFEFNSLTIERDLERLAEDLFVENHMPKVT